MAILCITAIVIGIVSASNKAPVEAPNDEPNSSENEPTPEVKPPVDENKGNEKLTFIVPTTGSVAKSHSLSLPVFSLTLGEWRVHTGIDVACQEGAEVFASADGTINNIYSDPMLGYTIEIKHNNEIITRYSNLDPNLAVGLNVGDTVKQGDKIGFVGDSSVSELAEEAHLHFEVVVKDVKVNPLDYFTEEEKRNKLNISTEDSEN